MLIELTDVGFTYLPGTPYAKTALRDVSLRIDEGEFIALVGPTGSGKSTLIQHLNGLLVPTAGTVRFDGRKIGESIQPYILRAEVGLVFQFPESQLFEETVADDIAFGPKNMGLAQEEVSRRVEEALSRVGLDYAVFAERSPFELSGGEMRLVAIAGVLAMRPTILILDEPTSGLDSIAKEAVIGVLKGLNKKGITVIMVTHDMDEVADLAKRVVVLNEGRVVLDGSPQRVFAEAELLKRIGLQVPATSELLLRLLACGLAVDTNAVTVPEAVATIRAALGEVKRC